MQQNLEWPNAFAAFVGFAPSKHTTEPSRSFAQGSPRLELGSRQGSFLSLQPAKPKRPTRRLQDAHNSIGHRPDSQKGSEPLHPD